MEPLCSYFHRSFHILKCKSQWLETSGNLCVKLRNSRKPSQYLR